MYWILFCLNTKQTFPWQIIRGESTDEEGNYYPGAKLQVYLNKRYYGGDTTVLCYNADNNTLACPTSTLDEASKSLIDNHKWNTGAIEYKTRTDTLAFYQDERGTKKR